MLSFIMNKVQTKRATSRITREASGKAHRSQEGISDSELVQLAKAGHAHDWLRDPAEDIYTLKDGMPAQWPTKHTNARA